MEECGELIQECSKNLRRGEFFDQQKFKDEVGDVYTMINLLHEWDVISWDEVEERERIKRRKLSKWSDLIGESETEMYEKENEKVVEGYQSRGHYE
jgi:NTP pyrophosphatase (non-canonical NTP hydrolase)